MNLTTYQREPVVAWYGKLNELFAAEQTIFALVTALRPQLDMVDLGVGGGRTAKQMARRCRSYLGVDYSPEMVAEARRTCDPSIDIVQGDARDMPNIPSDSADFVLFSYNGIDYVSHEDRLKILDEMKRIARPGGYVALSSHNLASLRAEFGWDGTPRGVIKFLLKQALNFPLAAKSKRDYALLNDGLHRFGLSTYYIRPDAQRRQLEAAGFSNIRMFGFDTGEEIEGDTTDDPYPYYLCQA